jgi:hypothetical protein
MGLYANKGLIKPELPEYNFNFLFSPNKTDDLEKVNRDRLKFGICTCETDQMKLKLEQKYGLKLMILDY